MRYVLFALLFACGSKESKKETPPAAVQPAAPAMTDAAVAVAVDAAAPADAAPAVAAADPSPPEGHDFTPIAKELLAVGACEGTPPENFPTELIKSHCDAIDKIQNDYTEGWLKAARPWFAEKVPAGLPTKVVYPFAGGDLSTALVVYPNAEEITTISLEPAGDPRTLEAMNHPAAPSDKKIAKAAPAPRTQTLSKALGTIEKELDRLYRVNFSNTLQMIDAMRGGALPTQLVFGLSALKVHGYEVVSLRYFRLEDNGNIHYLTDADVKKAPPVADGNAPLRNRIFANAELRFRKAGGPIQTYRHIAFNLDEEHMKDKRLVKHLEAKGEVSGMTKAASYLLSFDNFKTIRDYMMKHVVWMVSDATGIAPRWGTPAGFEYETYGSFTGPHIPAGHSISKDWEGLWKAQDSRPLPFRFGYYDAKTQNHLVIMRKKSK